LELLFRGQIGLSAITTFFPPAFASLVDAGLVGWLRGADARAAGMLNAGAT
jgi:hypothetical protein